MTVQKLYEKLSQFYPETLSACWDNDGIMVSADPSKEVRRVLVALDATDATVRYAAENGYDTVVVHHPMIFVGQKSVTPERAVGKRILDAALSGVSVISLHTRLDAGEDGVNDSLLNRLGFVPSEAFGDDETLNIARAAEIPPMTAKALGLLIKEKLGVPVRMTGDGDRLVKKLGVCGGAGKDFVSLAAHLGCDAYLTGECSYHTAADEAEESGLVTYEVGHYHSEAPVTERLVSLVRSLDGAPDCDSYDSCPYVVL